MLADFDKYYEHIPQKTRDHSFHNFWSSSQQDLKGLTLDSTIDKNSKKSSHRFTVYNIKYHSFMKTLIHAEVHIPKGKSKPNVQILIKDYNKKITRNQNNLDTQCAYCFCTLRGHDKIIKNESGEIVRPGFLKEHMHDPQLFYVRAVYLDILQTIKMLRLIPDLDCSSIGIYGQGFGAAVAIFAASYSNRVKALLLDSPSFCDLDFSQNIALSDAAFEINEMMPQRGAKRKTLKKNLTFFDAINFTDMIHVPVRMVVGIKDQESPAESSFGLFHHITSEKTMVLYPEKGFAPGGSSEFEESISWLNQEIVKEQ
jgi:cephalosporin-C deacetylase